MAEIEVNALARQCLDQRLSDRGTMARQVAVWEQGRNAAAATIQWRFTTADARIKLTHLYPVIEG